MKRLRRIIMNTLTLLSLLLCVRTVGLWIQSRSEIESIFGSRVSARHGEFLSEIQTIRQNRFESFVVRQVLWHFPVWPVFLTVILSTTILPVSWLCRYVKTYERRHDGKCQTCGYDLRATPERARNAALFQG
jgi:hypothetical protein